MRKLYKFYWDCGRMGFIDSLFIADESLIEKAIGRTIQFGEILGKHSDIYGVLHQKDLTVVTSDKAVIDLLEAECGREYTVISGHCPLSHIDFEE